MRFLTLVALLGLVCTIPAQGIPARGNPITVRQADGTTITIVVRGDEFSKWTSTIDGYQIIQQEGVYYYYEPKWSRAGGTLRKASDPRDRSAAETFALATRTKGRLTSGASSRTPRTERSLIQQNKFGKVVTTPSRTLVLLVAFKDLPFNTEHTVTTFDNMLNTSPTSARQYFSDNSQGIYTPSFDIKGPYTLPQPVAYYGANDQNDIDQDPKQMVIDACRLAAASGVNFSQYDQNQDGRVDNIYILYSGLNEAEGGGDDKVWPHHWNLGGKPEIRFNGVQVWSYACGSELSRSNDGTIILAGIGTFCHEFSHVLGLPDFYDTNNDINGQSVGLYHFSIMSTGNYNNDGRTPPYYTSLERSLLGWTELQDMEAGSEMTIQPVNLESDGWEITTENANEFYIVEARGSDKWDAYVYGSGLLIYHVDLSENDVFGNTALQLWNENKINAYADHPCVRLIESGGATLPYFLEEQKESEIRANVAKIFYPGSGNVTQFTGKSWGGVDWWDNPVAMELMSIRNQNGTVSFTPQAAPETLPLSFKASQWQVEVTISPKLYSEALSGSSFEFTTKTGGKVIGRTPLEGTPKSVTIGGLLPATHYIGTLWAIHPEYGKKQLSSSEFTTNAVTAPFPAITGLRGRIPVNSKVTLGVTNLPTGSAQVVFSINGTTIEGNSYRFSDRGQQIVRCTISYNAEDIEVIKRIVTIE